MKFERCQVSLRPLFRCHLKITLPFLVLDLLFGNFLLEFFVLVLEGADVLSEYVHIVVKGVVLLLGVDKVVGDLLEVIDPTPLLDLFKG